MMSCPQVEFIAALKHNQWNKRVELGAGEAVIMHSPQAIVHYPPPPNTSQVQFEEHQNRPKAVRREFPDLEHITQGKCVANSFKYSNRTYKYVAVIM